jgi:hypothetical protein
MSAYDPKRTIEAEFLAGATFVGVKSAVWARVWRGCTERCIF